MRIWPTGIGETTGDGLVLSTYLATKGGMGVIFVDSVTGNDSFSGVDRRQPKATLADALTAAPGIIVLLPTHDEVLTATIGLSIPGLVIVGAGLVAGKPTAKFRMNTAANLSIFSITGIGVELRNILFPENLQTNTAPKISIGETYARLIGCYFEQGAKDDGSAFDLVAGASHAEIRNTTIASTATVASNLPGFGARVLASIDGPHMDGLVLDGGAIGLLQNRGWHDTGGPSGLYVERLSQLRGADFQTGATGWIQTMTATGGARVAD